MKKLLTILTVIVFYGFCAPLAAEVSNIWKIGILVCPSGACAEHGNNSMEGITLAVDEINKSGGVLNARR